MPISFSTTKIPSIKSLINRSLDIIRQVFQPRVVIANENVKKVLRKHLDASPALLSLMSDDPNGLRAHFGLSAKDAATSVESIKNIFVDSLKASAIKKTKNGTIGFNIRAMKKDYKLIYDNVIGASYISPPSGELIEWLKWLLVDGTSIKIVGWRYFEREGKATSRSGLGIMVKSKSQFWAIPSIYAQDEEHNFIAEIINDPSFHTEVQLAVLKGMKGISV